MSGRDGHLNDLVAALVDGALDGPARDRALAHIAGCSACRADVDAQRQVKDRLSRLSGPEPPARVVERLQAALAADQGRPPGPGARSQPVRRGADRPPNRSGRIRRPAPESRRRRSRRWAGGLSVAALVLGAALVGNGAGNPTPAVSPPVSRYTVEHARSTGGFPGADPAAGAVMTVTVSR
ncbi:MAG: zf-HC2 domain-containing protein [Actinomycetota bacterium]|nr:zf-HC2 domain-containing protein [Actinomycetota bacterium]